MMNAHNLTRRTFLKTTAAIAIPSVVPASVFGQNAPSNRVNIAAIGVGGRGTANVMHGFVRSQSDVRVIVACDCFKSRREKFATEANKVYNAKVCEPMADWRQVLARDDVDGVVISTPDHWHVPLAYHAALAKKDMYVEKPLSLAMAWAWKLREALAKNDVIFQYGTQQRSEESFTRCVELVRNGYIGKVQYIDAWCNSMRAPGWYAQVYEEHYKNTEPADVPADLDYDMWIGPAPMSPYTKSRCTEWGTYHVYDNALGFIAGWGAHPLDIAQWGLDMDHTSPVRYQGSGEIPSTGLFDTIDTWDIYCEYADGTPMHFMCTRVAQDVAGKMDQRKRPFSDHGTTFWGEDGWLSVKRGGLYASSKELQQAQIKDSEKPIYRSTSQTRNFVECMRTRKPTINPLESAIRSDTISHMSDICIRLKRPIRWDPDKEQIIDDPEATNMLDRPMRKPFTM